MKKHPRKMSARERTKKLHDRHRYRRKIMDRSEGEPMKNRYVIPAGSACRVREFGGKWVSHITTMEWTLIGQVFPDGLVYFSVGKWQMRIAKKCVTRLP